MTDDIAFMRQAIRLAESSIDTGGGPFGAVIVYNNAVIGEGYNQVTADLDPTAHAEVKAIRHACKALNRFALEGCTIYTSCEPCPMCLGAVYWARLDRIVYANSRHEAAAIGFDDRHIYEQLAKPIDCQVIKAERLLSDEARASFTAWQSKSDKVPY